jgi:MtaA/CmuA family methyltransferase
MTGLDRTRTHVRGGGVDRLPFHPIVMRWAASQAGLPYRDYVLDPEAKSQANVSCARAHNMDWVTVLSDPYAEASAFGLVVEYPRDGLPKDTGGHLPHAAAVAALPRYRAQDHLRTRLRLEELARYRRHVGSTHLIVGWVEGPVAEYADLRGVTAAALDLLDDPETVVAAMDLIVDCAVDFITGQVEAGAHCIGIGDAFCSQIGPRLYRLLAWPGERRLVEHIHRLGALAKLHICGNTAAILPDMIATGADIIDVDHLVVDMAQFAPCLGPGQVLSGHVDPVTVVRDATPEQITAAARRDVVATGGRCIVSAGCEITPDTPVAHLRALRAATAPAH